MLLQDLAEEVMQNPGQQLNQVSWPHKEGSDWQDIEA